MKRILSIHFDRKEVRVVHDFLRSIGFSRITKKSEFKEILNSVLEDSSDKKFYELDQDTTFVEIRKDFGDDIGIAVCGEYDENDQFHMSYYYPYFSGTDASFEEYVEVEKHADRDAYLGICDDVKLGVTLIFYLQNISEYLNELRSNPKLKGSKSVTLSALAKSGTILFPVNKSEIEKKDTKESSNNRNSLIAAARDGDEDAIESLTLEDIDTYTMLSRRILHEDVLSIVDTCFMPYGIESDQYYIIGEILDVEKTENVCTKETVYVLKINCNDLLFNICVNKSDLLGEPDVGRRFKGSIWMQGSIHFLG